MDLKTYPSWLELYPENHERTLSAANNLGVSYRLTGNVAAALQLDGDTLARYRAAVGPRYHWTLNSARNVARDLLGGRRIRRGREKDGRYRPGVRGHARPEFHGGPERQGAPRRRASQRRPVG